MAFRLFKRKTKKKKSENSQQRNTFEPKQTIKKKTPESQKLENNLRM